MRYERGELLVYASRWKALWLTLCMLMPATLLLLGVMFLKTNGVALVVIPIMIALFLYGAVYYSYRLISRKPLLIVNDEGIFDNGSSVGVGLIRWDEIAGLFVWDRYIRLFVTYHYLCIIPNDMDALIARQSWLKRLGLRFLTSPWILPPPSPITIPQMLLPCKAKDLLPQIVLYDQAHPPLTPGERG